MVAEGNFGNKGGRSLVGYQTKKAKIVCTHSHIYKTKPQQGCTPGHWGCPYGESSAWRARGLRVLLSSPTHTHLRIFLSELGRIARSVCLYNTIQYNFEMIEKIQVVEN